MEYCQQIELFLLSKVSNVKNITPQNIAFNTRKTTATLHGGLTG